MDFRNNKKTAESKGMEKPTVSVENQRFEDFFRNRIRIPQAVLDELDSRGLDHRWINYNEFIKNGHMHKAGWEPYRPVAKSGDKQFGTDAEGYIRRGDALLASRPKALSQQHREFLDKKNKKYRNYQETASQQLRATLGKGVKIHEGYDENGDK